MDKSQDSGDKVLNVRTSGRKVQLMDKDGNEAYPRTKVECLDDYKSNSEDIVKDEIQLSADNTELSEGIYNDKREIIGNTSFKTIIFNLDKAYTKLDISSYKIGANGMDWMYANCSTTAQRGALDWMGPFHDAIKPVMEELYESVASGNEAQISIDSNSQQDYRKKLNAELEALHNSEMWRMGETVRKLRPENN